MQDNQRMQESSAPAEVPPAQPHRSSYVRMAIGKLKAPTDAAFKDGADLVEKCLAPLDDRTRFPPRLFILLATPRFFPLYGLVEGIRSRLAEQGLLGVPLIGSSVAVCFFDQAAHEDGALLVCLASRFIAARAAAGAGAQGDPPKAVHELLGQLRQGTGQVEGSYQAGEALPRLSSAKVVAREIANPRGNRFLLAFLPGFAASGDRSTYRATEVFGELRRQSFGRLPIFGGVSSGGLSPALGHQVLNDQVLDGAVVAARISSHVQFGLSFGSGLTDTGLSYRVKEVKEKRLVSRFWEGTPEEVRTQITVQTGGLFLMGRSSPNGDTTVAVPHWEAGHLKLAMAVEPQSVVHILKPDGVKLQDATRNQVTRAMERSDMDPRKVVGVLGISCVGRYREREKIGLNVTGALTRASSLFPSGALAGCCMDGEIGLGDLGQPIIGNWGVAVALFADHIPERSARYLGFDALALHSEEAPDIKSVSEAIQSILRSVDKAGYAGGMVSLTLKDGDRTWIVAHDALGERWRKKVLPLTRRPFEGDDVLAQVAREKKPRFIADSTRDMTHCDQKAVQEGDIVSQYIIPLLDKNRETMGLLQIDLGDMRDSELSDEHKLVLDAIGGMAAAAMETASYVEELQLARRLDEIQTSCLACATIGEALGRFASRAPEGLNVDGYIRVCVRGTTTFRLAAGTGRYYEEALRVRRDVEVGDHSPAMEAVRTKKMILVNDAPASPWLQAMRRRYPDTPLGSALEKVGAFVSMPIGPTDGDPIGVINVSAGQPWFFTPSRLRSLAHLGQRIYVLTVHIAEKQALRFLADVTPGLEAGVPLQGALQKHADLVRRAANADVVSCFLWDEDRNRYILRAQAGWHDSRWVDAAWYAPGEGMTGKLAGEGEPCHIPDLRFYKATRGERAGKYLEAMFGEVADESLVIEVLALPLHFGKQGLGILTLHRRSGHTDPNAVGFGALPRAVLSEAAHALAAYVYACQRQEGAARRERHMEALSHINELLLSETPAISALIEACEKTVEVCAAVGCAIYVGDPTGGALALLAQHCLPRAAQAPQEVPPGRDSLWLAFAEKAHEPEREEPADNQQDTERVRRDLEVRRICVPLLHGQDCLGALEVRWNGSLREATVVPSGITSLQFLEALAIRVSNAIQSRRLRAQRRRADESAASAERALSGLAQAFLGCMHSMSNDVQELQSAVGLLRGTGNETEKEEFLRAGQKRTAHLRSQIEAIRNAGARIVMTSRAPDRIDSIVNEAVGKHREMAQNIALVTSAPPVQGYVDHGQILQAMENVLANAIRAVRQGPLGGCKQITVCLRQPQGGSFCEILITDTGPGMNPEQVESVLGPKSTNGRGGVGLILAKLYCQNHGGDLRINSSPGTGTQVILRIELAQTTKEELP